VTWLELLNDNLTAQGRELENDWGPEFRTWRTDWMDILKTTRYQKAMITLKRIDNNVLTDIKYTDPNCPRHITNNITLFDAVFFVNRRRR
jgi:hypothetical protein